jgi:hypothetical protein
MAKQRQENFQLCWDKFTYCLPLSKEEIKEMITKWCEANKEKIKEKRSELINCECGNQYTFENKSCHLKSKLHIKYQNQLCGIIEEPKIIRPFEEVSK